MPNIYYRDNFKQAAAKFVRDHPSIKVKDCARFLNVPDSTLRYWYTAMYNELPFGSRQALKMTRQEKCFVESCLRVSAEQDAMKLLKEHPDRKMQSSATENQKKRCKASAAPASSSVDTEISSTSPDEKKLPDESMEIPSGRRKFFNFFKKYS